MDKKKISVMIPCYNEEENARPIYEAVKNELVTNLPQYDYEILFIDNKSTDSTRKIIREICYDRIIYLNFHFITQKEQSL